MSDVFKTMFGKVVDENKHRLPAYTHYKFPHYHSTPFIKLQIGNMPIYWPTD